MKLPKFDLSMQKTCKPAMLGRIWQASRRALNLEHSPPQQFAWCQWHKGRQPTRSYIVYRWVLFVVVLSTGIISFVCQRRPIKYEKPVPELNRFKWFIYFTNWGFMLIALQAFLALLVVHRYKAEVSYKLPCDEDEIPMPVSRRTRTPLLCRAYWLTHNVATDLAFVISLIYWTLVHDPKIHEINMMNLMVHGGNSVIMVCELVVTSHPMRMAHALYGAGAGLAYGIFSALYWAAGGTDRFGLHSIYPALDWDRPGSAFGFVALCAVVLVLAHGIATCIVMVRTRVAQRLIAKRAQTDRLTLPTH
ncbi:protein rolling stone isoform X2 [Manduca sexta]|uniref:protein rolling stone isoform X2 n=1 Tax=Manduca sexta TaxID=7130 RepID=UPI0011843D5C|nr:protein rolling stone isoform X2 [Manduca sexta]